MKSKIRIIITELEREKKKNIIALLSILAIWILVAWNTNGFNRESPFVLVKCCLGVLATMVVLESIFRGIFGSKSR